MCRYAENSDFVLRFAFFLVTLLSIPCDFRQKSWSFSSLFFVLIKLSSNQHFQLLQNIHLFEDVLYHSFNSCTFSFHSLDDTELLKLENLSGIFHSLLWLAVHFTKSSVLSLFGKEKKLPDFSLRWQKFYSLKFYFYSLKYMSILRQSFGLPRAHQTGLSSGFVIVGFLWL